MPEANKAVITQEGIQSSDTSERHYNICKSATVTTNRLINNHSLVARAEK
jgi:hypothetical protein